ncbi:MAG: YigZ family protein [Clostridium sp.]|nr:YigZ family protein [Clostridium sp.]
MGEYRLLYRGGTGEIVEKKSRFIADVAPIASEEEALSLIEGVRKKYWDARHHCFAYVVGPKDELMRFSDDGEPSGTAGRPILDVLTGSGLHNCLIIVTRYFGGTLLGTGGLVRAYTAAAKEGIANSTVMEVIPAARTRLHMDYTDLGKVQYILSEDGIVTERTEYAEGVDLTVLLPADMAEQEIKKLINATSGRISVTDEGEVRFGMDSSQPVIFE